MASAHALRVWEPLHRGFTENPHESRPHQAVVSALWLLLALVVLVGLLAWLLFKLT